MVGYGPEDTHFVVELTYNYGIKSYEKGNDFIGITVRSKEALERAKSQNWPVLPGNVLEAPGGYKFFLLDDPQPVDRGRVNIIYKPPQFAATLWLSLTIITVTMWRF